jgi:hypothetical protein
MADAPAPSSGGGWGALEVILALVLAIGLISTITGNPVPSLTGKSKIPATKTVTVAQPSCGIVVSSPKAQEKIGTEVLLSGSIVQCLTSTVPDTLNAHVVDATGASLSAVTAVTVNHGFFGGATFSTTIPLVGIAHSIKAYVVVSGPTHTDGSAETIRVPVQLIPADPLSAPSNTSGQAATHFNTTTSTSNYYATPVSNPAPYNPAPAYTAPPANPSPSGQATPSATPSGGGGTTF